MSKNQKRKPNKKKFNVLENESIADCLDRMKQEGYEPVRRVEKSVFKEENGQKIPLGRNIIFDAVKVKHEH